MTIEKISIRPTGHFIRDHSDVEWPLVIKAVLSPTEIHPNRRHGKSRWTYIKAFDGFVIEVHAERDTIEDIIWVINAFKVKR